MPLTIAILAGGKSSRFGQDKAALFLPGITAQCLATGLPILVVGRLAQPGIPDRVAFLPDAHPGEGPLGGIMSALRKVEGPILALACDLPALRQDALDWLIQRWEQAEGADILVASHPQADTASLLEPLFAIYTPACLPIAEGLLQTGRRSLHQLIQHCQWQAAPLPKDLIHQLHNINTPDDLRRSALGQMGDDRLVVRDSPERKLVENGP